MIQKSVLLESPAVPPGTRVSPHEPTVNNALIVLNFAGTALREVGIVPSTLDGGIALSPCGGGGACAKGGVTRLLTFWLAAAICV